MALKQEFSPSRHQTTAKHLSDGVCILLYDYEKRKMIQVARHVGLF